MLKGGAEDGGEFVAVLALVLVVLIGWRGTRLSARGVGSVRWIRVALLGTPKLASTDGLHVCKGDVLFVVQVVEDLVVRGAEDAVVKGFDLRVARITD